MSNIDKSSFLFVSVNVELLGSYSFGLGSSFWPFFFFFPETYAPVILKHRARRLRKETGDETIIAPIELEKTDFSHIITVVLTRPVRMICFEPLVLFTCLYLSYACKSIQYRNEEAKLTKSG